MKKILILLLLVFVVGCTGKYSKPFNTIEAGKSVEPEVVEEMAIAEEDGIEETALTGGGGKGSDFVEETALLQDGDMESVFRDVMFEFNKYNIREDSRPVLDNVASFLNQDRKMNIVVEGYCDERGTNEYNLALGEKRAKATKNYLISLGVLPSKIITTTYGEEKSLCSQQNESCWQKNRRAHFSVLE